MEPHWSQISYEYIIFLKYFVKFRKLDHLTVTPLDLKEAEDRLLKGLELLEQRLKSSKYLISDKVTLADLVAIADIAQMNFLINRNDYFKDKTKINEWYKRMFEVEAVQDLHKIVFELIRKSHEKYADMLR